MRDQKLTSAFDKENTGKEQSFTSTGDKLLHHKTALRDLRTKKIIRSCCISCLPRYATSSVYSVRSRNGEA
jgi:hypothetical protein